MAKKRKRPEDVSPADYVEAADAFLDGVARDLATSRREMEPVRVAMVQAVRDAMRSGINQMQTAKVGRARIIIPNPRNRAIADKVSRRVEERFSRFRLQWLDQDQLRKRISEGWTKAQRTEFHRHSNRLARNARLFLERVQELEPSLADEVQASLNQLKDARNDLLKLEVRSFTKANEQLLRNINGRATKGEALADVQTFDIDRNLWNLSLLQHPQGVVRDLMANSSERMAAKVTETVSEIPKRAFVFVGAGSDAVSRMTPSSRSAEVMWRLFSADQLDRRFAALNRSRGPTSNWRGLGLAHNTPEWYVPVPDDKRDEIRRLMRERRQDFLAGLQIRE